MHLQPYSIWSLLVLIADVYAIVLTGQSSATTGVKVVWIVVIIVLPVLGFILWLLFGPKGHR
ncbi:MAG: PLDc N-terminal domain-containing protein [Gammaproteobacteria bacterium]|nr:PLDc N-terminal domain-containing protein [Gammaproteobacteria bacterium]